MSNYRSKKGTVIKIPDGLTPKQIAAIKADADAGYGTRAQETANKLGKQVAKAGKGTDLPDLGFGPAAPVSVTPQAPIAPAAPTSGVPSPPPPLSSGIDPATGNINVDNAGATLAAARQTDAETQFKLEHPDETDQYGNTITYSRGPNGEVVRKVTQGETATKFREMALAAAGSWNPEGERKKAEEATYGTLTKYYDRDMAKELEDQKQELANRGIPYDPAAAQDPNTKDLYGRTIGGIGEKYRGLKDTASQQAILSGNQSYATTESAKNAYLNSVMAGSNTYGSEFGNYVNTIQSQLGDDTLSILSMSAQQYATLKGISVQEAESLRNDTLRQKELKEQTRSNKAGEGIARMVANKPTGGGGGGASTDTGGFDI